MKPFRYIKAKSVEQAIDAASASPNAKFVAGGTNLLDLMKLGIEAPDTIIDINAVGLDAIEETTEGGLRIGALVRNADLAADMRVRRAYPLLSRALLAGASPQLRNMATTSGNLLQRTRCPYFYDTNQACNKRAPGSGCSALKGESRQLAVVGGSEHCIATYPGDMAVALRALDATIEVQGRAGAKRAIAIADFHHLPGDTPQIENALAAGELITAVTLPKAPPGQQFYRKVRDRASYAFALVSIAAIVTGERAGRFAVGGIAPRPWRVDSADTALENGAKPAATELLKGAAPTEANKFKLALVERTLNAVLNSARG